MSRLFSKTRPDHGFVVSLVAWCRFRLRPRFAVSLTQDGCFSSLDLSQVGCTPVWLWSLWLCHNARFYHSWVVSQVVVSQCFEVAVSQIKVCFVWLLREESLRLVVLLRVVGLLLCSRKFLNSTLLPPKFPVIVCERL